MTAFVRAGEVAEELCKEMIEADFGPYFGTPCRSLTVLHAALHGQVGILTVGREDNAIGIAAGTSLSGRTPVVLMEQSGIGNCVSAITSLVVPYRIPMLLVIGMADPGSEGHLPGPVLDELGVETVALDPGEPLAAQVEKLDVIVQKRLRPAALLVPPAAFEGVGE
jgi:sulfopyruvate decarboxylase subunit alpha